MDGDPYDHDISDVVPLPDEIAAWAAAAPLGSGLLTPWGVLDPGELSDGGRIDALVACQRLAAWADAQAQRLLAALEDAPDPVGKQYFRDEVSCALHISTGAVADRVHVAGELVHRLPATLDQLETGTITLAHARVLADATTLLAPALTTRVEARVLPRAGRQSVAAFRASVYRAVLAVEPRDTERRHQAAAEDRRVALTPLPDGMTELWALLPADGAATLMTTLTAVAATAPRTDARTVDQRRADALVSLAAHTLATCELPRWQGRRPTVQVTVAATTLLGLDDHPGDLEGHGPIPAAMARAIAADLTGTWRRLVTDPISGALLDYGRTTYRPPQDLTDHVVARDRTCRFPGCRRPARRCEIDHQRPWDDGGTTDPRNCECLCTRHHHLKHEAGWQVTGDPATTLTWTSPTGHTYRAPPDRYG